MTAQDRRRAHARALADSLEGRVPPSLHAELAKPTYEDLEREVQKFQGVIRALKDCRDGKCHLCAACVGAVWLTASQKARKPYRRKG